MSEPKVNYIVQAPSFYEASGGRIFLHELVHALNMRGEDAKLVPMDPVIKMSKRKRLKRLLTGGEPFKTNPELNTPVGTKADVGPNTVVMYPEIVLGNPLNARFVARWLLYQPGGNHPYEFTENEMYFRVDEFADDPELTGGAPDLFMWKVNRTYRNENRPDRKGACFMVRKGTHVPRHPITEDAIKVDGLTHEELNEIFNQCDTFYSYDDATMYSQYAAVAGCLSVVLPSGDASRDAMLENHMMGRYGIAYGLEPEKLEHARATQHKVIDLLNEREAAGQRTVDNFIRITKAEVAARLAKA